MRSVTTLKQPVAADRLSQYMDSGDGTLGRLADMVADLGQFDQYDFEQLIAACLGALAGIAGVRGNTRLAAHLIVVMQQMGLDESEPAAVQLDPVVRGRPRRGPSKDPGRGGLTAREWEVAVQITRGLTNNRIAAELMISGRTADTHVVNILNKLGLTSRSQIAAWQVEQRQASCQRESDRDSRIRDLEPVHKARL